MSADGLLRMGRKKRKGVPTKASLKAASGLSGDHVTAIDMDGGESVPGPHWFRRA